MQDDARVVVTTDIVDTRAVITVVGDLDLSAARRLTRAITDWSESASIGLILNLSGVEYIDSVGLGCIVKASRWCRDRNATVAVVGAQEQVRRVMRMTQVDSLVDLHDTVDSAIALSASA